jgi:hypothetical protein
VPLWGDGACGNSGAWQEMFERGEAQKGARRGGGARRLANDRPRETCLLVFLSTKFVYKCTLTAIVPIAIMTSQALGGQMGDFVVIGVRRSKETHEGRIWVQNEEGPGGVWSSVEQC